MTHTYILQTLFAFESIYIPLKLPSSQILLSVDFRGLRVNDTAGKGAQSSSFPWGRVSSKGKKWNDMNKLNLELISAYAAV
jgi:hypothetical protein